jgi:hypothetical protein
LARQVNLHVRPRRARPNAELRFRTRRWVLFLKIDNSINSVLIIRAKKGDTQ